MRPHHNRAMRFQRGIHYPHPPRGPARKSYTMSEAALRQRRRNLKRTRIRSDCETAIIKRLIWQACFDGGERPSQRALARQLRVWPSYVWKVQRKALSEGLDALVANGERVGLDDLEKARCFTEKVRADSPDILVALPALVVPSIVLPDSRALPPPHATPWWLTREWQSTDEIWGCILLTQEQKVQASAELERKEYAMNYSSTFSTRDQGIRRINVVTEE